MYIYCKAHMKYMYTYFVLTSINLICSCFIHVQQHAPPWIAGTGHPCYDRSLFNSLFCLYYIYMCVFVLLVWILYVSILCDLPLTSWCNRLEQYITDTGRCPGSWLAWTSCNERNTKGDVLLIIDWTYNWIHIDELFKGRNSCRKYLTIFFIWWSGMVETASAYCVRNSNSLMNYEKTSISIWQMR